MRKIFLITFLFLILFFTILIIYLSTVGIKTSKFNQLINNEECGVPVYNPITQTFNESKEEFISLYL